MLLAHGVFHYISEPPFRSLNLRHEMSNSKSIRPHQEMQNLVRSTRVKLGVKNDPLWLDLVNAARIQNLERALYAPYAGCQRLVHFSPSQTVTE